MKREDDDDTIPSEVAFAHAPTAPAPAAMPEEFDENHLVPLTPSQESERRFPPGCPVWYCNIDYSSSSNRRHGTTLEARHGVVRAIFIDLRSSRELVYGVESNGSSSPDDDGAAGGGHYSFLLEGQLAFASNCRIRARGMLDERDPDDAGLEGVILCPLFPPPLSYAVRFHLGGTGSRRVTVKYAVDPNLLVYDPSPSSTGGDGGEPADQKIPSRRGGATRDSPPTVEERECDPASTHLLIDTSPGNNTEATNPREHSQNAQVKRRSLTVASADFRSDVISCDGVGGEPADEILSRREEVTRDSQERECDKTNDSASNQFLIDTSSDYYIEATNPQEQSRTAQVQRRSLTVPSAVFCPDAMDDEFTSIGGRITSDGGGGGGGGVQAAARRINGGERGFRLPDPPRKHGVEKTSSSLVPGLGITTTKRPWTPDGSVEDFVVNRKIWIPTNRDYKELLIGPGGSRHRELIASAGGGVSIKLRGRVGNSTKGERPKETFVLLEGRKECVDKAEMLVRELLENNEVSGSVKNSACTPHDVNTETSRKANVMEGGEEAHVNDSALGCPQKRQRLSDAASLSDHPNAKETIDEHPRKASKVVGKTCILTVPLWVMKKGNNLFEHLSGEIGRIQEKTTCSVKIRPYNIKDENLQIIISESENRGLQKARGMIEGSLIEFLNDEGSNSRLLYELMTTLTGSINLQHVLTSNGLVHHEDPNRLRVWMKLLELPYFAFKGKHRPHGKFLQDYFVQKELTYGTDCSIIVYGFGYKTPAYCDPYILVSARKKEEVSIVEERVIEKLRAHQGACSMCCKFLSYSQCMGTGLGGLTAQHLPFIHRGWL